MKLRSTLSLVLLLAVFFSACSLPSGGAPTTEVQTEAPAEYLGNLKIAVLPIIDTLPMFVA